MVRHVAHIRWDNYELNAGRCNIRKPVLRTYYQSAQVRQIRLYIKCKNIKRPLPSWKYRWIRKTLVIAILGNDEEIIKRIKHSQRRYWKKQLRRRISRSWKIIQKIAKYTIPTKWNANASHHRNQII